MNSFSHVTYFKVCLPLEDFVILKSPYISMDLDSEADKTSVGTFIVVPSPPPSSTSHGFIGMFYKITPHKRQNRVGLTRG